MIQLCRLCYDVVTLRALCDIKEVLPKYSCDVREYKQAECMETLHNIYSPQVSCHYNHTKLTKATCTFLSGDTSFPPI